jgi:broad specificity phosphatase PhoE
VRIFLVARHGQSLFNVDDVVNGDPLLDRGLSEQGIEEAERLGGQLGPIGIDALVVSPFPRAVQTANIALGTRGVPHEVDDDLGDVRIGELEGAKLADYRTAPAHDDPTLRFPGGESLNEAALRYAAAFRRLLERSEPVTLVVCHEIPVRYAVNAAAGSDDLNGPLHLVANATPYLFDEASLGRAVEWIDALAGQPRRDSSTDSSR